MTFVAKNILTETIKQSVAPELKRRGYRKRGLTWVWASDSVSKVFNVQGSQFNSASDSSFTVNLGVHHPEFHMERYGFLSPGALSEPDCDIRVRIGALMGRTDYWWQIAWNKDNGKVMAGFIHNINEYAYSWLDALSSLSDMYRYFTQHGMHFDTAVASRLLSVDPSEHVSRALEEANVHFAKRIRHWMRKHDI